MEYFRKNPNHPEGAVRTELHISGSEESCNYLHDLIVEIAEPYDSYEEPDGMVVIYIQDSAERVFNQLYERLCGLYPELIGKPEGVTIEDEVLYFKDCEIYVHSYPNH